MAATLPISKLIQVNVTLTATAAQGPDLNSAMIVGDSNVIDIVTRYRGYEDLPSVANDFGTSAPEYIGADAFFSQSPTPQQLYIGRWAEAATPGQLFGGPLSAAQQLISLWTAITTGAFLLYEDGIPFNVSGLNFSTATNLNGVASIIQTALVAHEASSIVVWNSNYERFEFTSGTTGITSSVSFLKTSAGVGSVAFAGQPTATHTLTIDGTVITFVASGATGNQVNIGTDTAHTLANLLAFLGSSTDANLIKSTYSVVASTLYAVSVATGTTGNAYTLATNDSNLTISGATFAGGSAGTNISAMLGGTFSTTSGVYVVPGAPAESALAGVQAIERVFANWYGLAFAAGTNNADVADSDYLAVAAYIEGDANRHLFAVTTSEGGALISGDSTTIGALLHAAGYVRSFMQWSSTSPYAAISMLGLGCTVDFDGSNTTINFAWQTQPGITAENLNENQSAALDANCYNYYAFFNNNTAITVNGFLASGHYIDEIWNADWFGSTLQTAAFNVLRTARTKIPQTDAGMNVFATTFEGVCDQGVTNGFLAPGIWNSAGFGTIKEGDFLPKGYYIYQPPIAKQSIADRAARKTVSFQIAAKEAGAVNDVVVNVTVNQ